MKIPLQVISLFLLSALCSLADNDRQLEYILDRYLELSGGRGAYEKLTSLKISGHMKTNSKAPVSFVLLKKKPNKFRMTIDQGSYRVTQAYDGETAWAMIEQRGQVRYRKLDGLQATQFIRGAPIENPLINVGEHDYVLRLGEDTSVAGFPCYQVIIDYKDGWKTVYLIEKKSFREIRIIQKNPEDEIIDTIAPTDFAFHDGILFSRKINRIGNSKNNSTHVVDTIDINIGLLETVFSPPANFQIESSR